MSMSSVIFLYGLLAIVMLRGVLDLYGVVAQTSSRPRLEHEFHLTLTHMLTATPPEVTVQNPDSTASMLANRPDGSGSATVISVRRTRSTR